MKKIFILLLVILSFCTKEEKPIITEYTTIKLTRPQMEQYMQILPLVLKKSQKFRSISSNKNLEAEKFNYLFYNYLFQDKDLAIKLKDIGFKNGQSYGTFHDTVLQMFLILQKQPKIVKNAIVIIPTLEKKLNPLMLKLAREPNNTELKKSVNQLQEQLNVYNNLVLVNVFLSRLMIMNQNAS